MRRSMPEDAFSILALTDVDLYAEDSGPKRLLFGQGHYFNRSAAASLYQLTTSETELLHHRAFKLVAHELLHTFAMRHCSKFRCLMNSSMSVSSSDARPLHLCPDCLEKLQYAVGFDPLQRYRDLERAASAALSEDELWFSKRRAWLENN